MECKFNPLSFSIFCHCMTPPRRTFSVVLTHSCRSRNPVTAVSFKRQDESGILHFPFKNVKFQNYTTYTHDSYNSPFKEKEKRGQLSSGRKIISLPSSLSNCPKHLQQFLIATEMPPYHVCEYPKVSSKMFKKNAKDQTAPDSSSENELCELSRINEPLLDSPEIPILPSKDKQALNNSTELIQQDQNNFLVSNHEDTFTLETVTAKLQKIDKSSNDESVDESDTSKNSTVSASRFTAQAVHDKYVYSVDPLSLTSYAVKKRVSKHFSRFDVQSTPVASSSWKDTPYPLPSVMWPNPLLHNFRLKPYYLTKINSTEESSYDASETVLQVQFNKKRLEALLQYSNSHGISWDYLDLLYEQFVVTRDEKIKEWDKYKDEISKYAGVVSTCRLRKYRLRFLKRKGVSLDEKTDYVKENLLEPRSLFRKWTRKLYMYWRTRYLHPWSAGSLTEYLKAVVTEKMLCREAAERYLDLPLPKENSEHNEENEDIAERLPMKWTNHLEFNKWDMEGVGMSRHKRLQRQKFLMQKKIREKNY